MRYAWAVIVGLMLTMGVSTYARQIPRAPQVLRAGVDLVQVDVSVLDKNRRPVLGLKATDFTLLEDGKPRPVAAFVAVGLPAHPATTKAPWMRDVPSDVATNDVPDEGRLVIIVMDRSIPFGLPAQTARAVARAAIEQLSPGDLAAVVYTGSGAPQGFTGDRGRLLAAIGDNPAAGLSRDAAEHWEVQQDRLEAEAWSVDDAKAGVPRILPTDVSGECSCGLCVLDSIKTIADAVRDTQGRKKSLLFIGADIATDVSMGDVRGGNLALDPCYYPAIDARTAMFKSIDLANLTVHAFDASGLETNVVAPSTSGLGLAAPISPRVGAPTIATAQSQKLMARQGHLAVLPDRTGGRLVKNTNSPEDRVADVFRESDSYYLLGFEPTVTDGREHTISVQVNRPGMNVASRRAYIANRPATFASTMAGDRVRDAIADVIAQRNGITLTANALTVAAPVTHSPTLIVALHAQYEASAEPLTSRPEQVDIVTAVFTTDGRPVGTFSQTVAVTPRADAPGAGMAYDVLQRMTAKPGSYELRIAVNNAVRHQSGTVYAFVDVPAISKTPFIWSDIGISESASSPATNDGLADLMPVLPIATRDFGRQERVTAFISAYHSSGPVPAPMEIVTHITDEQNHQKLEQKTSLSASDFDQSGAAAYTFDLPLASLVPGSYLLTMDTTAGKAKTTRYVRFTVR